MRKLKQSKIEKSFIEGCRDGFVNVVKTLIPLCYSIMDRGLALASLHGHIDIVEELLYCGANPKYRDSQALRWATENAHPNIVALLLFAGANPFANNREAFITAQRNGFSFILGMLEDCIPEEQRRYEENLLTLTETKPFSWKETYNRAKEIRENYRSWLFSKIEEEELKEKPRPGLIEYFSKEISLLDGDDIYYCDSCGRNPPSKQCPCGETAILTTNDGLNQWGTRTVVGDVEWGRIEEPPKWKYLGWSIHQELWNPSIEEEIPTAGHVKTLVFENREELSKASFNGEIIFHYPTKKGYIVKLLQFHNEASIPVFLDGPKNIEGDDQYANEDAIVITDWQEKQEASGGPELINVFEYSFEDIEAAKGKAAEIEKNWRNGDHSEEILVKGRDSNGLYKMKVILSDKNWDHHNELCYRRDVMFWRAEYCIKNVQSLEKLEKLEKRVKLRSRDAIVRKGKVGVPFSVKIKDRGRKTSIGFNYIRYATLMNLISERKMEMDLDTESGTKIEPKRFNIKTYETKNTSEKAPSKSEDILDRGAAVGFFKALRVIDEVSPSTEETNRQPVKTSPSRLYFRSWEGPACGPIVSSRSYTDIVLDDVAA
jgi:hypothetical protein